MRITAAEAREISDPSRKHVDAVYLYIYKAAQQEMTFIDLSGEFWSQEGYRRTHAYKKACEVLRGNGYTVQFYYHEQQFVDMRTRVSW